MHHAKAHSSKATHDSPRRTRDPQTNRRTQLAANVHIKNEPLERSVCRIPSEGTSAMSADRAKQPNPTSCKVQKRGNPELSRVFNSATKFGDSPQKRLGLQIDRHPAQLGGKAMQGLGLDRHRRKTGTFSPASMATVR